MACEGPDAWPAPISEELVLVVVCRRRYKHANRGESFLVVLRKFRLLLVCNPFWALCRG